MEAVKKTGARVMQTKNLLAKDGSSNLSCSERTNLDHEADKRKRVIVQHDAANIADYLSQTATQHAGHEAPATPSPAKVGVDSSNDAKRNGEEDVGRQRRSEAVDAPFHGAGGQRAVGVGAKGAYIRWDLVHISRVRDVYEMERCQGTKCK